MMRWWGPSGGLPCWCSVLFVGGVGMDKRGVYRVRVIAPGCY
jgi:hypothetical protein